MAQVNTTPGKNQVFANKAVVPAISETGATGAKTIATNTVVNYMQNEPGKSQHDGIRN